MHASTPQRETACRVDSLCGCVMDACNRYIGTELPVTCLLPIYSLRAVGGAVSYIDISMNYPCDTLQNNFLHGCMDHVQRVQNSSYHASGMHVCQIGKAVHREHLVPRLVHPKPALKQYPLLLQTQLHSYDVP